MKKLVHYIKQKLKPIRERHIISKVSMIKDYIFAAIKIIFGIFIQSYILSVGGLYSICVGLAKNAFFEGKKAGKDLDVTSPEYKKNEYKHLAKMAAFILAGSVTYVIYMARLFFTESIFNYGGIPAIAIAAVSFTELTLAIINLKKSKGALYTGLRCVNLTTAFTAIVLTQVAILSFAHNADSSFYNAVSGTVFGGLCVVLAIVMFAYCFVYKRKTAILTVPAQSEKKACAE